MRFDSKLFNPQAFGSYVNRIPNVTKNELARSAAVGTNEQAARSLSTQTGSLYTRVPYFGRISAQTSQNNDGATDITSKNTSTYSQGFVFASRMDGWTERSFSKNITAGVDFMDNVAKQIADYKMEVKQNILLAMLKGIFSMSVGTSTIEEQAAKEFIEKHTYDLSTKTGDYSKDLYSIITLPNGEKKAIKSVIFESYGTNRFMNLFPILNLNIKKGGTLIIDEYDASIHPMAIINIINIFHNDEINTKNAQLIFNTYNPIFLRDTVFRRDEIKFTERNDGDYSILYSLSEFKGIDKSRKARDYSENYFIGMYGAVKDINFTSIFTQEN